MKRLYTACLVCLLFVGASTLETLALNVRPKQPQTKRLSSVYALAGEFRTVEANLLWLKADQYHHEFEQANTNWTKDTDLLGLLNLITDLDPHFIEAYSSGAVIYARGSKAPHKAIEYLDEGIRFNPDAWELHRIAAIIYARQLNQPIKALPYARAAARYAETDFDRQIALRLLRTVERMAAEHKAN